MCWARCALIPGSTSTRTSLRTSSGASAPSAIAVSPPRDMPITARASGASWRTAAATSTAFPYASSGPSGVSGAIRVAVPGQVDGHQGPVQRHRHRVPGMGVLGAAVQQDQLRVPVLPHQRAEPPPGATSAKTRRTAGGRVERQAELRGVLIEHPELVVVSHGPSMADRTRCPGGGGRPGARRARHPFGPKILTERAGCHLPASILSPRIFTPYFPRVMVHDHGRCESSDT